MRYIRIVFCMMVAVLGFIGCSKDETEKRSEFTQIVERKDAQECMSELYLAADGDNEALSRILHCTPSTIERIKEGETSPTLEFEDNIREVLVYYNLHDRSFSKLRSALDEEYGWYDSILYFPSHHPWWFWSINIVLLLILAFAALIAIWPILLEMLIFLVAWIAMLICSPAQMEDTYIDSINPVIEQKL